jgi:hypothetical protein
MSTEILQLIRKQRRLWKKAKYGQATDEYEATSRDLKNKIRAAKRKMEKKLATADSRNKKPFYNYVKNKTKTCESVGPQKTPDGHLVTDSRAMANILNNSFSTVFTREEHANVPRATPLKTRTKLSKSFITTQKVKAQIKKLKKNKLSWSRWHHQHRPSTMY